MVTGGEPLLDLLRALQARNYRFTAVTPATHARVLQRPEPAVPTLRDGFGWNRPFEAESLENGVFASLAAAGAIEQTKSALRSAVRVASLGSALFLHSSYPTDRPDSVFFGPDTYRFVRFVRDRIPRLGSPRWIVDMGAGSGAGGIMSSLAVPDARITLVDTNSAALRLASINAAAAGVAVETYRGREMPHGAYLVIANPPYMMDPERRAYRDGGDLLGGAVALNWTEQALSALAPGGTMLLYTGVALSGGEAPLLDALRDRCSRAGASLEWDEIDPDVFGEALSEPAYAEVERIAAVGAVINKG